MADEYEKDDNRYGAGRGAHKNLRRAEKELILASKTPCRVQVSVFYIVKFVWQMAIVINANPAPLLHALRGIYRAKAGEGRGEASISGMLYFLLLLRFSFVPEKKRLQEQFAAEQDTLYGSRLVVKKPLGLSTGASTMV
ncbi:hypothetical protein NC653_000494 [Populus alba x Populus x berolinensis]|uniref:Uncharacterized protein n=1 Tax=Populus alba x Populus x berolinensis TaxID=444605 RepID=A0AAD6RIQ2_9ROSI|nr:hypothetical protein NC653_000494 [Populus alba x Populus x berolinensis]